MLRSHNAAHGQSVDTCVGAGSRNRTCLPEGGCFTDTYAAIAFHRQIVRVRDSSRSLVPYPLVSVPQPRRACQLGNEGHELLTAQAVTLAIKGNNAVNLANVSLRKPVGTIRGLQVATPFTRHKEL